MTPEPTPDKGAAAPAKSPAEPEKLPAKRGGLRRILVPLVGAAALGLVAYVVPLRDRCESVSPVSATGAAHVSGKKVATDRHEDGTCILHEVTGDLALTAPECSSLRCEPGLLPVVAHANLPLLILLALVTLVGYTFSALRWLMLLRLAGFRRPFAWVWRACISSQAGSLFLPAGIGGDALRLGLTFGANKEDSAGSAEEPAEEGIPTATIAATVVLDRALGLVSLTTLGGCLAAAFGGSTTGKLVYILVAIPPLFFLGFGLARTDFVFGWAIWRRGFGAKLEPVLLYIRRPGAFAAVARGLLASAVFSGLQLAVVRGTVFALGGTSIGAGEPWIFLGGAMALVVSGLPGLPGGWGTADAAYVFFLGRAGLPPSTALAVCLLNRIYYYVLALTGAGVLLSGSVTAGRAMRAKERAA